MLANSKEDHKELYFPISGLGLKRINLEPKHGKRRPEGAFEQGLEGSVFHSRLKTCSSIKPSTLVAETTEFGMLLKGKVSATYGTRRE